MFGGRLSVTFEGRPDPQAVVLSHRDSELRKALVQALRAVREPQRDFKRVEDAVALLHGRMNAPPKKVIRTIYEIMAERAVLNQGHRLLELTEPLRNRVLSALQWMGKGGYVVDERGVQGTAAVGPAFNREWGVVNFNPSTLTFERSHPQGDVHTVTVHPKSVAHDYLVRHSPVRGNQKAEERITNALKTKLGVSG